MTDSDAKIPGYMARLTAAAIVMEREKAILDSAANELDDFLASLHAMLDRLKAANRRYAESYATAEIIRFPARRQA